jgi:DNA-binding transcriptional LysR family regulator
MEIYQVRYFLAVHEARNFTRAAERCGVSQPALTAAMKKLEQELDGPLFHRERGGAKLTSLGELVLPRFRRLAAESASIAEIAENHRLLKNVPVRLGILTTIGPMRLAPYLETFRHQAPSVELEIQIEPRDRLMKRLEEADLELLIGCDSVSPPEWLVVKPLYQERYVVVLPEDHPLAAKTTLTIDDLNGERYIDRLGCELRESITHLCAEQNIELYANFRTEQEGWIECLVRAGVGFAFLPEHSILSPHTVRRPLLRPALQRTICLMRSVEHSISPAAKLLWDTFSSQDLTTNGAILYRTFGAKRVPKQPNQ